MLSELLQYGVTPEMLKREAWRWGQNLFCMPNYRILRLFMKLFLEKIHEKYMTTEEVPDRLCDVIEQSAVIRNVTVYLDDFTGFTPIQYRR